VEKAWLRVDEVAEVLGLGRSKLYAMIVRGELPSVRVGRSVRVPREELFAWIGSQVGATGSSCSRNGATKATRQSEQREEP
jgi:excisionase family DNA binding protein